jgi:hypothetical protein
MAAKKTIPLGIELVKRGVLTENDIQRALEYQKSNPKKKLGDIINILKLCPEETLCKAMGNILGENFIPQQVV